ncbi:MAG TPA: hypothetical protein VMM60_06610, partial [Ilumatobacter sp.]|nr:hypothetical protein [Ilumatobacter sp.]
MSHIWSRRHATIRLVATATMAASAVVLSVASGAVGAQHIGTVIVEEFGDSTGVTLRDAVAMANDVDADVDMIVLPPG